jgi:hypothetical protein
VENISNNEPRWNLFARELEDILAIRGLRLGHLRYRTDEFGAPLVHHEKVRRLKHSLRAKSFTLLNPEELERVMKAFEFTSEEHSRLRAALLATAVEVTLMDRINPDSALRAAEQILPVLRQALDSPDEDNGLRSIRGGGTAMLEDEAQGGIELDTRFEKALDALDRGTLALHLARSTGRHQERIDQAQQALEKFHAALRLLDTATDHERDQETWQLWQSEARHGGEQAAQILAHFGISASGTA